MLLLSRTYVPILKWKQGERNAVRYLDKEIRDSICPVLNVVKDTEPKQFLRWTLNDWGTQRSFYLDFHPTYNGDLKTFLEEILALDEANDLCFMPVLSKDKPEDYLKTLKEHRDRLQDGVALRVDLEQLDEVEEIAGTIAGDAELQASSVDLIVDTNELPGTASMLLSPIAKVINTFLSGLKNHQYFRSVTLAGSSFPASLNVPQNEVTLLPRYELQLWEEVVQEHKHVRFGDYGVDDPKDVTYKTRVTIIPTIRYAVDDGWLIIRGNYDSEKPYDYKSTTAANPQDGFNS